MQPKLRALLTSIGLALISVGLAADEGMWTFDNIPLKKMLEKYGFAPDANWLKHAQLSAINFGGGSASFISSNGLVITNHHVGRGSIQRLSTPENDYFRNGFIAKTMEDELKVPGLTVRTVIQMENVTDTVNAAVKPGMSPKDAQEARQKAFAEIARSLGEKTELEPRQVTLYRGGEYWVYLNKVHTDLRLVAAPEGQLGFFGGDLDNFTYPRHDLDFCIFRVYENDKPCQPSNFLKMPSVPLKAGDLTFVVGNPGSTSRQLTYAQMCFNRDYTAPAALANLNSRRDAILAAAAAASTADEKRRIMNSIFGVENSLKAQTGYYKGLLNVDAMKRIKDAEDELRAKIQADPKLRAEAGDSHAKIEEAVKLNIAAFKEQQAASGFVGDLVDRLLIIVGQVMDQPQQSADMPMAMAQARERAAAQAKERAIGEFAFDKDKEITALASALERAQKELGSHPLVKSALNGRSPKDVAKAAIEGTKLAQPAARKALLDGGRAAIQASKDPLLAIAVNVQKIQANVRQVQARSQETISEHAPRIAKARFAVYGKEIYPDATGTLRLTYGAVETYNANGTKIQPFTTFYGLYDRHIGWGGNSAAAENGSWTLPERWLQMKDKLDLSTPINFVHTVDTIGGNSGSPVLNTKGEIVGLLFDGIIESLPNNYYYDDKFNRSVSVDIRAVLESLNNIYDAAHIV
ncbi:MAG: S46 family peptidase, partial [Holophagales bacterium]|nr:S46 family peptidase [Holophagales bacterium]